MPRILVVEQEQRYVERISEALSSQGWDVEGVPDRAAAVQHVADHETSLVVVNSEVDDSKALIKLFSRHFGGPGTVVLVPENAQDGTDGFGGDEVLQKPFSDQDIRLAVRRCLTGAAKAGATTAVASAESGADAEVAAGSERRLTSEDIFGDVVSELESTFALGGQGAVDVAEQPEADEPGESRKAETTARAQAAAGSVGAEVSEAVETISTRPEPEPEAESEPVAVVEEALAAAQGTAAEPDLVAEGAEAPPVAAAEAEAEEEPADVEAVAPGEVEAAEELEASPLDESEEAEEPEKLEAEVALDPAAILDARIRQAAEEGKRLAESRPTTANRAATDAAQSTDALLRRVLMGIDDADEPEQTKAQEKETSVEVDELVSSIVQPEPAPRAAFEDSPPQAREAEAVDPILAASLGSEAEAGEYGTRLRLIWAAIIVVVLVLLGFIISSSIGEGASAEDLPTGSTTVPSTPDAAVGPSQAPSSVAGDAAAGDVVAAGETDAEADLQRELEDQRRELQEEISKARSSADGSDGP